MNNKPNNQKNGKPNKKRIFAFLPYILIPLIMFGAISLASGGMENGKDKVEYYEIIQYFDEGKVDKFSLNLSSGTLKYTLVGEDQKQMEYRVPNVNIFVNDVNEIVREHNKEASKEDMIEYEFISGSAGSWLVNLLPSLLTMGLLVGLFFFMMKRMNSASGDMNRTLNFGKINAKKQKDEKNKTTFDQVAGADEEKEELSEMVDFLKSPAKFNSLGARIPKGVLLVGPPGTGKTLLARAVAGEADVPFFSISGSDFVEMYVGVGASRVRDLFNQAKRESPSVIFIDEIDAVGRQRGAGMGGGHDEREQTLNQLLVEMDGFGKNEGVIIIAATNRPDILDPALLRPGRFDRQVTVGYPDATGREAILKVHAKGKPFAPDVDLKVIANSTAGFVGADLENLLNEAALLAARRNKKAITMAEIEEATRKVVIGTEKKSHKMSEKEKRMTAFHEAGHAVASYYLDSQDPVHEVSIIPRGMAGGYTLYIPTEDKTYKYKSEMLDELVSLLGGRVAEQIVRGDVSTGASNDIERATEIAKKMITKYGMSDALGPVCYAGHNDQVFLGRDYGHAKNYSEATAMAIDEEIKKTISNAYKRTEEILTQHRDKLDSLAEYLVKNEKIDGEKFRKLMEGTLEIDDEPHEVLEAVDEIKTDAPAEETAETEE
ncbi:MAG: ATP-dependent zinc metalloprotease FtsH [Acutalibacteraceae bacterium]|nr:ATP-dependent zinc metalloprotease FtsH [Acutalibacteraceae bacterium]